MKSAEKVAKIRKLDQLLPVQPGQVSERSDDFVEPENAPTKSADDLDKESAEVLSGPTE